MPNLFEQFKKKPVQVSKPKKEVSYRVKPSWASDMTDDEWNQYIFGDLQLKHEILTRLWSKQDLPF